MTAAQAGAAESGELAGAAESGGHGDPIRIGVLGTGRIGRMHARLLANDVSGATLGMVYDPVTEAAQAVATEFDVPAARSVDEVLAAPDLDAVAICTSTDTHVDLLMAAARSGKGIFCEKPISLDLEQVDRALTVV